MFKQTVSAIAVLTAIGLSPIASMNIASAQDETPTNEYWWPNRLDLTPLRTSAAASNPLDASFNYAEAFKTVDVEQLKKDLAAVMTTSQDWWPADYGHYGPFFIRMSWHSAGTYRTVDGRGGGDGGMQRFAPLNSWPDNGNLDKARRLLWPLKQKYGNAVSWSDLIAFAGTIAMEDMGFKIEGFAFGREDAWEPEEVNWGPEGEWLAREGRHDANGKLKKPFGAARMGLIYVNPEGPNGNPDPLLAANEIRDTFGRMAMNDEETIALIAGGHTFGKAHGAARGENLGKEPEAASLEQQGLGWKNKYGTGKGGDTITSGLEGAWTVSPTQWTHNFFQNLFEYDWKLTKSPAGAHQWIPTDEYAGELVPDAHDLDKRHAPIMLTTDLALKEDPGFRAVSERFYNNPEEFEKAFARAWFKLTHRDMGPRTRYLGSLVPSDERIWQDPVPAVDHKLVDTRDVINLKAKILASGVSVPELVRTAWSSASSYRDTDKRGGTNGARIRLAPQNDWEANSPAELAKVLKALEAVQSDFNKAQSDGTKISLADMIVLGGAAAIEQAAKNAGQNITVPFKPGRTDASQAMTDVASFDFLKPAADGFRNYFENGNDRSPAAMLVEKAALLNLSVPEMTVLVGGMRALDANTSGAEHGVFTSRPGTLSNDYFVNLLDMSTEWKKSSRIVGVYEGADRRTGAQKWTATPVDLIFGSNSELRAVAEFYGLEGAQATFLEDFAEAWTKVMNLGRFDLQ